jgi:geranylgeranyl reductase family protein
MSHSDTVAIVGAGPAGSVVAEALAGAGRRVTLFDEKLAWEKPCGGGVTYKAFAHWPSLYDAKVDRNWVRACELISPSGRRVSFQLEQPIAIFSRRVLNGLLLDKARQAGACVVHDRVVNIEHRDGRWCLRSNQSSWEADYLVIAAGARNAFRKQFSPAFAPEDLMVTAGYYIAGRSQVMQIQFLHDLHGYIWIFPRADHFSAGICGKMQAKTTAEFRRLLEQALTDFGLDYQGASFYSHVLPSLRATTLRERAVSGEGWALVGDAAGFVDPMTGEGLHYAMRSAELLAQALLAGHPDSYSELLWQDFLPELELAAEMAERFYTGRWMGEAVTERTVQFIANSASFRALMSDLFAGTQGYRDLRRRLYRTLPAMLAESLASALRLPTTECEVEVHSRAG